MSKEKNMSSTGLSFPRISVERAIAEFRASRPVLITGPAGNILATAVEGFDSEMATFVGAFGSGRLLLPAARLRRMGLGQTEIEAGAVALPSIDPARIERLALQIDARIDAPVSRISEIDSSALELARLSLTIPAVVVVAVEIVPEHIVAVDMHAIQQFRALEARDLHIVGRAPVPLEHAPDTEFVVFRGGEGLRDQVAIIVGKPDLSSVVQVRLHSACLTGDLFGSLKCDCGDQLRGTVTAMAEGEGGILLYLDQEGRGNGIANKMRAYRLQSQGWDTYDADEVLGFELDQRRFDFAATMLKQLGVTKVDIMTNNPVKMQALRDAGLEVVSEQRVIGRPTKENVRYLTSKRDRAGHAIDTDALVARLTAGE